MAAKVTIANLKDCGFRKEQFGRSADAAGFDALLTEIVGEAGRWAEARIGASVYAAATTGVTFDRLKLAEQYKASAELWRRRAAYIDGNATTGLEAAQYAERRQYFADAKSCDELADAWLAVAVSDNPADVPGSALAVGLTETGLFSPTVEGAVTA